MLDPENLAEKVRASLPAGSTVEFRDTTGTGDHFEAQVVSPLFEGKSMVDQHRLVYAPLKELLDSGELHALQLRTYSPSQWEKKKK